MGEGVCLFPEVQSPDQDAAAYWSGNQTLGSNRLFLRCVVITRCAFNGSLRYHIVLTSTSLYAAPDDQNEANARCTSSYPIPTAGGWSYSMHTGPLAPCHAACQSERSQEGK